MKKNSIDLGCPSRIIALVAVTMLVTIACDFGNDADNSQYYLDPPTGIVPTLLSDEYHIHLTWNAVPNAQYYEISFRTNLDSADTRRNVGTSTITQYQNWYYYWWWYDLPYVTTLYFYLKTYPSKAGYIASGWSDPVSVIIR